MFIAAGAVAVALAFAAPVAATAASGTEITLTTPTASPSGTVHVTGEFFAPTETLTVAVDGVDQSPTATSDATGVLTGYDVYLADNISVGAHTITVTGSTSASPASATLTVVAAPVLTLSPAQATVTQAQTTGFTATVTGFTANDTVTFGMGTSAMGDVIGTAVADASGTATLTYVFKAGASFAVAAPTVYTVSASNDDFSITSGGSTFTVTADPAAPVAPAAPATPVQSNASFTG